jgi:hypothetical protein
LHLEYNSYLTGAAAETVFNSPPFTDKTILQRLQGFYARGTALTRLPGFLQYALFLDELDIAGTAITELPPFVLELSSLRYLNIEDTSIDAAALPKWFAGKTGIDTSPEALAAYWARKGRKCSH